jgi:hypothetical protein
LEIAKVVSIGEESAVSSDGFVEDFFPDAFGLEDWFDKFASSAHSRIAEDRSALSYQSALSHRNIQAVPLFESGALT